MGKTLKSLICLVLCLSMVAIPVYGAENALTISTAEEFLTFAESCRLDSYSKGLTVTLGADIDLSHAEFDGVPIFYGTFLGSGHTVSGVNITCDGSNLGLFRHVEAGAVIRELNVSGTVAPQGSRSNVGGIAGTNAGQLLGCTFEGEVTGADTVGGIAGTNTGTIEACIAKAQIYGDHFVGGIAGQNPGVIRDSINKGDVNATEKQNDIDISDITLDTLTDAESSVTVTDIGGIAGTSSGVIRGCENHGTVGYLHIGYNIGGIAGSQMGFLTQCTNYGSVFGRKDVGGIVGQMEPNTVMQYDEDTLQILQQQLNELSYLTDRAAANADSGASALGDQLTALDGYVNDAKNAAQQLLPGTEDRELPDSAQDAADQIQTDLDSAIAARNQLSGSMLQIQTTLESIADGTEDTAGTLTKDLTAISKQMDTINQTLDNAEQTLSGSVTDISDADTPEDTAGKVSLSANQGAVNGDWNAGGITGVMGYESDLDPESDIHITGELSLNFACDVRAVVRDCKSTGSLTVKSQNAGGIVGLATLGLIRDCENTGSLYGTNADYVGGIAGQSAGFIRNSSTKAAVEGAAYIGGIAGIGNVVTDCRAMTRLTGKESLGGILGQAENRDQITGNYYLCVGADPGGIGGISFDGCSQPLSLTDFLALESLPELFKTNTLTFTFADGTQKILTVPQGSSPEADQIPQIPEQEGSRGIWEGTKGETLDSILFDAEFKTVYTVLSTAMESQPRSDGKLPVFIAQGSFSQGVSLRAESIPVDPRMEACLDAWNLTLPEGTTGLRYLLPEGCSADRVILRLQGADGTWRDVTFSVDGSYLAFAAESDDVALQLVQAPRDYTLLLILIGAGAVLIAGTVTAVIIIKKRKKKTPAPTE